MENHHWIDQNNPIEGLMLINRCTNWIYDNEIELTDKDSKFSVEITASIRDVGWSDSVSKATRLASLHTLALSNFLNSGGGCLWSTRAFKMDVKSLEHRSLAGQGFVQQLRGKSTNSIRPQSRASQLVESIHILGSLTIIKPLILHQIGKDTTPGGLVKWAYIKQEDEKESLSNVSTQRSWTLHCTVFRAR